MASLGRTRRRAITEKALMPALRGGHVLVQISGRAEKAISIEGKRVSPAQFRRLLDEKLIRRVAFWEKGNPRGVTSWYELTEKGRAR